MRETLYDYQKLFNCIRPDEPIDLYPDETPEFSNCDYCKSYNGEKATAVFTVKDHFAGKIDILYLCDDCQKEDHIFRNKTVLRMTKLNN